MILTKPQLDQITQLFAAQTLPATFPDDAEFDFMLIIAQDMTLQDYLAMPALERDKWWINSRIMPPVRLAMTDTTTGDELYETGYYFEPVSPGILNRIY